MAKIERIPSTNTARPSREDAELQIGLNNKVWYDSPITSLLSAATVLCDYWSVNGNETTFTETANLTEDHKKSKRYTLIKNVTMYERTADEIEDQNQATERRLRIDLADKTSIILGGTFIPKEFDHIILHSHKNMGVGGIPFMVTKVIPRKLIDKEVYQIEYKASSIYQSEEDLIKGTVKTMIYKSGNIGSGSAVVIDEETDIALGNIETTIDNIQNQLVEAFYDTDLGTYAFRSSLYGNYIFNYYANDMMQEKHQLLKFGYNNNTLFFTNIYKFDRETANYNTSYYEKMLNRDFKLLEDTFPEAGDNLVTSGAASIFHQVLDIRDAINNEYNKYIPKYSYNLKLYLRQKSNHLIFSPLYNTDLILVDLLNNAGFVDPLLKSSCYTYEIRHPLLCQFFDAWMDKNDQWIHQNLKLLYNYHPDKDNIDDYIGATLLLLILRQFYKEVSKDTYVPAYAKKLNK